VQKATPLRGVQIPQFRMAWHSKIKLISKNHIFFFSVTILTRAIYSITRNFLIT
jgi:hypothetical protein